MAEIVGLVAAIIELSKVLQSAIGIVEKFRKASDQQKDFRDEAGRLFILLLRLRSRADDEQEKSSEGQSSKKWHGSAEPLKVELDVLKGLLEALVDRTTNRKSLQRLAWKWDEEKCNTILTKVERVKSSILFLLSEETNDIVTDLKRGFDEKRRQEILDWLPVIDFREKQDTVFKQAVKGTGDWFLKSSTFEEWDSNAGKTLWCPGIPGAGKTVMASIIINYLQKKCLNTNSNDEAVVFVYFDYNQRDRQKSMSIYWEILVQILRTRKTIPKFIQNKYLSNQETGAQIKLQDIIYFLQVVAKTYHRLNIVVDALDESPEHDRSTFVQNMRTLSPTTSLLVTSRFIPSIGDLFENCLHEKVLAGDDDVKMYVYDQIYRNNRLAGIVRKDQGFGDEIVQKVLEKAQDMFLLARLHMTTLTSQLTKNGIRDRLKELPASLDDTYKTTLDRLRQQEDPQSDLALKVLMWLSFALRPLHLVELQHALSIDLGQEAFDEDNLVADLSDLTSSCAGLAVVEGPEQVIRLVHYTTQEYFHRYFLGADPVADVQIAKTCLTYLLFEDFRQKRDRRDMLRSLPLVSYAVRHWATHARVGIEGRPDLQELALRFLREGRQTDTFLVDPMPEDAFEARPPKGWPNRRRPKGLHIAASYGLTIIVSKLLDSGVDANMADGAGDSALHYAAWNGHYDVARLLLDRGALVGFQSKLNGSQPIHLAAVSGHKEVVQLLLDRGADIDVECKDNFVGTFPLYEAIIHGHDHVVELLLKRGAQFTKQSHRMRKTALFEACHNNRHNILRMLIKKGVPISGQVFVEPLLSCLSDNRSGMLDILLEHGADPNEIVEEPYDMLDLAIQRSIRNVIRVLLEHGARPASEWSADQPLILQWRGEPWYPSLHRVCVKSGHASTAQKDMKAVQEVVESNEYNEFLQSQDYKGFTHFGARPQFIVDGGFVDKAVEADPQNLRCLEMRIPDTFDLVERIVITTESHDQGWSDHYRDAHGTYHMSYTWFDIFFQYNSEPKRPAFQETFQRNVNSRVEWKRHVNTLESSGPDVLFADAISRLQGGDVLRIYPRAYFAGWVNFVRFMKMEVYGKGRT